MIDFHICGTMYVFPLTAFLVKRPARLIGPGILAVALCCPSTAIRLGIHLFIIWGALEYNIVVIRSNL